MLRHAHSGSLWLSLALSGSLWLPLARSCSLKLPIALRICVQHPPSAHKALAQLAAALLRCNTFCCSEQELTKVIAIGSRGGLRGIKTLLNAKPESRIFNGFKWLHCLDDCPLFYLVLCHYLLSHFDKHILYICMSDPWYKKILKESDELFIGAFFIIDKIFRYYTFL